MYSTKKINPGPRTGRQITVVGSLTEAAVLVADVQVGGWEAGMRRLPAAAAAAATTEATAARRRCSMSVHRPPTPTPPPARPPLQAGCPAVVHVIDTVLLPDIIKEPTLWETLATIWATGGAVAEEKAAPSLLV